MEALCNNLHIKSTDIRSSLNLPPSSLAAIYKKLKIDYISKDKTMASGKYISGTDAREILKSKGFNYPTKAEVISFSVCKGGAGKSTSAFFTAQRLSAYGAKVLVIDSDLQGNLTTAFNFEAHGIHITEETPILLDIFDGTSTIDEIIIPYSEYLHVIPSTPMNSRLESILNEKYKNPSKPFIKILDAIKTNYDYILIDCAPAFNLINTAIACASDLTILLANPDKFSKISLHQTLAELEDIENEFELTINKKILFSKFDQREKVSMKYLGELLGEHDEIMFQTMIRISSDVKNAISNNEYLFDYKKSKAKEDYDRLAQEIMGIDVLFQKNNKEQ